MTKGDETHLNVSKVLFHNQVMEIGKVKESNMGQGKVREIRRAVREKSHLEQNFDKFGTVNHLIDVLLLFLFEIVTTSCVLTSVLFLCCRFSTPQPCRLRSVRCGLQ